MKQGFFITGTDTEIGKTFVSCTLLHAARAAGHTALGMKVIAAGCDEQGRNDDVEALRAASSRQLPVDRVCPYLFAPPVAPHIAAREAGVTIDPQRIAAAFAALKDEAEVLIVEGVGGFRVLLGKEFDTADLAVQLGLPVILVVGLRLGCINHALLTAEAIRARGLTLCGWIANTLEPRMARLEENVAALTETIPAPLLACLPWSPAGAASAAGAIPGGLWR